MAIFGGDGGEWGWVGVAIFVGGEVAIHFGVKCQNILVAEGAKYFWGGGGGKQKHFAEPPSNFLPSPTSLLHHKSMI